MTSPDAAALAALRTHAVFRKAPGGSTAVVLCHFNPCSYRLRTRNLLQVLDALSPTGLAVYVAELRCGAAAQGHSVLPTDSPQVFQVVSDGVLWQKENLWNVVVRRLPERYDAILCLDADVLLTSGAWPVALETALRTWPVVHPYSRAVWLDPAGRHLSDRFSSGWASVRGLELAADPREYHPGFGFGVRREFWDACGGFYNAPLGNGDWMFVAAMAGRADDLQPSLSALSEPYWQHYKAWALRVREWAGGALGCLDGDALHLWHGSKRDRQYVQRVSRLAGFDPYTDVQLNGATGVAEWTSSARRLKPEMIKSVESYFATRLEDSGSV